MQVNSFTHPFFTAFIEKFKITMIYLHQHFFVYYFFLFAILAVIAIIVFTAPRRQSLPTKTASPKAPVLPTSRDIAAIAGDDVIATQLDLAKAYIEMEQLHHAKRILNDVLKLGNTSQVAAARELIETL